MMKLWLSLKDDRYWSVIFIFRKYIITVKTYAAKTFCICRHSAWHNFINRIVLHIMKFITRTYFCLAKIRSQHTQTLHFKQVKRRRKLLVGKFSVIRPIKVLNASIGVNCPYMLMLNSVDECVNKILRTLPLRTYTLTFQIHRK